MNLVNLAWHQIDDAPQAELADSLDDARPSESVSQVTTNSTRQRSPRSKISELAIAFVFIYSAVGFLIWQRTDQRIADLEAELGLLQSRLSKAQAQSTPKLSDSASIAPYRMKSIKPQWREMVDAFEAYGHLGNGDSKSIKSQWRFLVDALKTYPHLEESYEPPAKGYTPVNLTLVLEDQDLLDEILAHHAPSFDQQNMHHNLAYLLIEFILTEYGSHKIPIMLDSFTHHEDWETLSTAVFDLTAAEFEAEWHTYLQKTYGERRHKNERTRQIPVSNAPYLFIQRSSNALPVTIFSYQTNSR